MTFGECPTLWHLSHFWNSDHQVIEGDVAVTPLRISVSLTHTTARVTKRSSTLIDNILIDVNRVKAKTTVFETGLSDHKAQEIVFKEFYIKTKKIKSHLLQRVYKKKNTETFKSFLATKDWTSIKTADNAKDAFEIFFKNVTSSFLAASQKTKVKIKNTKKKRTGLQRELKLLGIACIF